MLFVPKRLCLCYYIICMAVRLNEYNVYLFLEFSKLIFLNCYINCMHLSSPLWKFIFLKNWRENSRDVFLSFLVDVLLQEHAWLFPQKVLGNKFWFLRCLKIFNGGSLIKLFENNMQVNACMNKKVPGSTWTFKF